MRFTFFISMISLLLSACQGDVQLSGETVKVDCLLNEVPIETEIAVIGAYQSGVRSKKSRSERSNDDENQIYDKIFVEAPSLNQPMIFIVSGYERIDWDFSEIEDEHIQGIIAYGYDQQMVSGAPKNISVKYVSFDRRKKYNRSMSRNCGRTIYVYRGGPKLDELVLQIESITGLKVTKFRGAYEPKYVNLDAENENHIYTIDDEDMWAERDGLKHLVEKNKIRRSTLSDIESWNDAATERLYTRDLARYQAETLGRRSTYTLLDNVTLPDGMVGGHSREFIVPVGVNMPKDTGSHNRYFIVKTGDCKRAKGRDCNLD